MPNWTTNAMVCTKEDAAKILVPNPETYSSESCAYIIDFNEFIEMPDSLQQISGTITRDAIDYVQGNLDDSRVEQTYLNRNIDESKILGEDDNGRFFEDDGLMTMPKFHLDGKDYVIETLEQFKKLGEIYLDNIDKYGADTWYDWSIANWGVKWNACDVFTYYIGKYALIIFSTPWGTVSENLLHEMTKYFDSDFIFEYVYEDEQNTVYTAGNWDGVDVNDSCLFEAVSETFDDDEWMYAEVKDFDEFYLDSIFYR